MASDPAEPRAAASRLPVRPIVIGLLLLAGVELRVHDALVADVSRGYDWWGHLDRIHFDLVRGRSPSPAEFQEGWEYNQPPLYYRLTAHSLGVADAALGIHLDGFRELRPEPPKRPGRPSRVFYDLVIPGEEGPRSIGGGGIHRPYLAYLGLQSVAFSLLGVACVGLVARRLSETDEGELPWACALGALFLPVSISISHAPGNAALGQAFSAAAIVVFAWADRSPRPVASSIALGAVLGLALLCRLTALSIVLACACLLALPALRASTPERRRDARLRLGLTLGVFGGLAAIRIVPQWLHFGTPLPTWDGPWWPEMDALRTLFAPGVRNLGDFLAVSPSTLWTPYVAPEGFLLAGTPPPNVHHVWDWLYTSLWYPPEVGKVLPPPPSPWGARACVIGGLVPTAVTLVGALEARERYRDGDRSTRRLLGLLGAHAAIHLAVTVRVIVYVPVLIQVHSRHLLAITAPGAVLFGLGLQGIARRSPALGAGAAAACAAYALVVCAVYRL